MRWNGKFLIVNILKHIYAKNIFANFPHFIAAAHRTIKRCARRSASHSVWIRVCIWVRCGLMPHQVLSEKAIQQNGSNECKTMECFAWTLLFEADFEIWLNRAWGIFAICIRPKWHDGCFQCVAYIWGMWQAAANRMNVKLKHWLPIENNGWLAAELQMHWNWLVGRNWRKSFWIPMGRNRFWCSVYVVSFCRASIACVTQPFRD